MPKTVSRRHFIRTAATLAAGAASWNLAAGDRGDRPLFGISLAQWSLHRKISGIKPGDTPPWRMFDKLREDTDSYMRGDLDPLDFPAYTREQFGIDAVEYVNTFYFDKAHDDAYLKQLDQRARDAGVKSLLIMCDGEGSLGAPDEEQRAKSVENHHRWVDAAAFLGQRRLGSKAFGGRAEKAGRGRLEQARRIRRTPRHQRHRRKPRRPVERRLVAGGRYEGRRPSACRNPSRFR